MRDYPVREVLAVYQAHALREAIIVENDFYHTIPNCGELEDIPFCLSVSSALRLVRDLSGLKVHYRAGYSPGKAPADLASACLELAAWNMTRYRGRRTREVKAISMDEYPMAEKVVWVMDKLNTPRISSG